MIVFGGALGELNDRRRLLEDLAPRSRTKWLCVATKAKVIVREIPRLTCGQSTELIPLEAALHLRLAAKQHVYYSPSSSDAAKDLRGSRPRVRSEIECRRRKEGGVERRRRTSRG